MEMKDYRITVRFPADLRQKLRKATKRTGVQTSEFVRDAVERRLAQEQRLAHEEEGQTAYDRALKSGLIGAIRDAPPDLSTNPKYFEGFGES